MLKHTLRALRRAPAFTFIAILSLGLAVAVNTSLFGFVDALVNPFQPYANADRVFSSYTIGGDQRTLTDPTTVERTLRDALRSAEATASFVTASAMVAGGGNTEDRLVVGASPNIFELLGVRPEVGRTFQTANDPEAGAVISYAIWDQWFQRRAIQAGLKLTVGSATFKVIGVMPRGVHFPLLTSVWIRAADLPPEIKAQSQQPEIAFRLRAGKKVEIARRQLNDGLARLAAEYGQSAPGSAVLIPLHVRSMPMSNYRITLAIAALVLIIAAANLGTMMLARGFARRREIAIRVALGASQRAIWSEVLAECGLVAIAGVAVGLVLTLWTMDVVPHLVASQVPLLGDVRPTPSWRVFAFASIACGLIILLAGWLPAARAGRMDPGEAMKDGGATTGSRRDRYNPLLILEVAVSTGLITTAFLYAQFASSLASFHFAYNANRLIVATVKLPPAAVAAAAVPQYYADALLRLGNLPHATGAATRYVIGPDHGVVTGEGGASGNTWANLSRVTVVSPAYLRTIGINVVQGRDFEKGDATASAGVVIVDERAAKMLWPHDDETVGHQVKLGPVESLSPWLRVIGVAQLVELEPRADPDLPPEAQVYLVRPSDSTANREVVVQGDRAGGRAGQSALVTSVRQELQDLAPWMGNARVALWLQKYEASVDYTSFLAMMFAVFGVFGLVLCAVGLFGVAAYAVSRRSRELALRIALGAPTAHIMRLVVHDAGVMVAGGVASGALATLWATRGLRDTLSIAGHELVFALLAAECVLLVVAFGACYGPVVRAKAADPVEVLRAN